MQGQTSNDTTEREGGLVGVGASGAPSGNQMVDENMQPGQRGVEKEGGVLAGKKVDHSAFGADERPNESA